MNNYVEIYTDLQKANAINVALNLASDYDQARAYDLIDKLESLEKQSRKAVRESGQKTFDLLAAAGHTDADYYGKFDQARNDLAELFSRYEI